MTEQPQQEEFFDAVYADPDMTAENKATWLHNCTSEYAARMRLCAQILSGEITVQEVEEFLEERRQFIRQEIRAGEGTL